MARAKKPMKKESNQYKKKRLATRDAWFEANPPADNGYWECYLRISPSCLRMVDRTTIVLEHVKPKQRHPELRFEVSNIQPSCEPCNMKKSGYELDKFVDEYPHLLVYV
jgi:5-methylcytosine-specific restriction endonuclease McrA